MINVDTVFLAQEQVEQARAQAETDRFLRAFAGMVRKAHEQAGKLDDRDFGRLRDYAKVLGFTSADYTGYRAVLAEADRLAGLSTTVDARREALEAARRAAQDSDQENAGEIARTKLDMRQRSAAGTLNVEQATDGNLQVDRLHQQQIQRRAEHASAIARAEYAMQEASKAAEVLAELRATHPLLFAELTEQPATEPEPELIPA